jgi:hypothetical protein
MASSSPGSRRATIMTTGDKKIQLPLEHLAAIWKGK